MKEDGEGRCGRRCKDAEMQQCMSTVYEYECDGLYDQIDKRHTYDTTITCRGDKPPFHMNTTHTLTKRDNPFIFSYLF